MIDAAILTTESDIMILINISKPVLPPHDKKNKAPYMEAGNIRMPKTKLVILCLK